MPNERSCVISGSDIDRVLSKVLDLDYKDTRFSLWGCQPTPGVEDSLVIDLRPSRWEYHPSSISAKCVDRGYEKLCLVEADIISTFRMVSEIREKVDEIHTGYEHGVEEYACKVVAVHEHEGEYHNHVSCFPVDTEKIADVLSELIEIAKKGEEAWW